MLFLSECSFVSNAVDGERNGFSYLLSSWSFSKPIKPVLLDNGRIVDIALVEVDVAADAGDCTGA